MKGGKRKKRTVRGIWGRVVKEQTILNPGSYKSLKLWISSKTVYYLQLIYLHDPGHYSRNTKIIQKYCWINFICSRKSRQLKRDNIKTKYLRNTMILFYVRSLLLWSIDLFNYYMIFTFCTIRQNNLRRT